MLRIGATLLFLLASVAGAEPYQVARPVFGHDQTRGVPTGNQFGSVPGYPYEPVGLPTVDQVLIEIAQGTVDVVAERFRQLMIEFGNRGVLRVQQSIDELLKKNLSAKELAILSAVLEMASDEQIREAASGLRGGALRVGPWNELAQAIAAHLAKRNDLAPELKALKILANQTIEILALTPDAQKEFRQSQTRFREAMTLLGDDKIDGRGIAKLASASGRVIGASLREFGRDIKLALQPARLEKTIDAALLLTNTFANANVESKVLLRPILIRELERDRIVIGPNNRVDWKTTLEQMATLAPTDARTVTSVLKQHGKLDKAEAQQIENTIAQLEDAHRAYDDLARYSRMPRATTPQEFQTQMEDVQQLATEWNHRGRLSNDVKSGVIRVAAAFSAASSAREANRMIQEGLEQRRINQERRSQNERTATMPTPGRITR